MAGHGRGRLRTVPVTTVRGNGCCASDDPPRSREAVECELAPDTPDFKSTSFYLDGLKQVPLLL